jgi:uncharacterized membrane protein
VTAVPKSHVIDMAHPSAIAVHAARTVLVASVIPMAIFYLAMSTLGLSAAILAALGWYYACLLARLIRRRPLVGATMLGAGLMTVRTVIAFWTGSSYLFFLQPVAGTVATAVSFAVTAMAGRPLLERLAHDFVPLPPALSLRLRATRFFDYTSLLWALMYAVNALGTVWLLTSSSIGVFLLMKTVLSPVLTGATIAITYLLFRRLLLREGVRLRWQPRSLPTRLSDVPFG